MADGLTDTMEVYLVLGPTRMPHFAPNRACEHDFRYLQALGKSNSDIHTPGVSMKQWRYNSMVLGFDL